MREFRDFLFKGDAFDVAAGIIIGTAFGKLVTSIVEDLVMPLLSLISPRVDWRQWAVHVGASSIRVGHLAGSLVDFAIVSLVLFFVVTRVVRRLR